MYQSGTYESKLLLEECVSCECVASLAKTVHFLTHCWGKHSISQKTLALTSPAVSPICSLAEVCVCRHRRYTGDDPCCVLNSSATREPVGTRTSKTSILLSLCRLVDVSRQEGQEKNKMSFLSLHLRPFPLLSASLLEVKRGRTRG